VYTCIRFYKHAASSNSSGSTGMQRLAPASPASSRSLRRRQLLALSINQALSSPF
jgi:hypothetical protein